MTKFSETKQYLTREDAIKFIKRRYRKGVTYFVHAGSFTYIRTPEECVDDEKPRGYEMMANVEVSQRAAIKYVNDMVGDVFAERGVKIQVGDSGNLEFPGCIFIG